MLSSFRHLKQVGCAGRILGMSKELRPVARGRMLSVQYSLPKLPVPQLQQTLDKYLRSVRPLVSDSEYAKTVQIVKEFVHKQGPQLQQLLEKRAQDHTNWLTDWWRNVAYLNYRLPLVVNFNPAVAFPLQPYRGVEEQLRFAARFISGVLEYKTMVDNQSLPVETLGGKPLCMMQYYQILAACRVPGHKKDTHVVFPASGPKPPNHICVFHNNHIFSVPVCDHRGHMLNRDQLLKQLTTVMEQSQQRATPVGLLTTMDRDSWAHAYHDLTKDRKNLSYAEEIQRSIFVLSLDSPMSQDIDSASKRSQVAAQMLHGCGAEFNSGNRWFDKTLQFIIGANGACGLNYEHTTAEGPPIAAIMDYVLDYVAADKETHLPAEDVDPPRRLDFVVTGLVSEAIGQATQQMASLVKDVQLTVFKFDVYGKDFIKACSLSPDAFIQVALQLAFFRIFKQPAAMYETASTRRFQLGRTDTIRSCTPESFEFCKAFDTCVGDSNKVTILKNAIKAHRQYTDEAVNGKAIDRHLLGLKLSALEAGQNIPELFLDTSFAASTYFRLSTSQVASKHDAVMCFGPAVPDGFGICYNPQNNRLNFSVSAYHTCSKTDSDKFVGVLGQSLKDMQNLLLSAARQAKL